MDIVIDRLNTEEDLMILSSRGRYELIKGVIHKLAPAGEEHGIIELNIASIVRQYVKEKKLGVVSGAETGYKLSSDPDTVRAPDVAFKSNERLSKGGITKGYSTIMPDLVIEVNSPGDSHGKVLNKVNEWLLSGVRQVWVIDTDDKSVIVYNKPGQYFILLKDNILDGGDLLPGFKCRVSDIFDIN
jgi:Uma2 family endonuclease